MLDDLDITAMADAYLVPYAANIALALVIFLLENGWLAR